MVWYVADVNYALQKTASQSVTYQNRIYYAASMAVDGNLDTRTSAYSGYYSTYWWKVDIEEQIIFTYATFYVGK